MRGIDPACKRHAKSVMIDITAHLFSSANIQRIRKCANIASNKRVPIATHKKVFSASEPQPALKQYPLISVFNPPMLSLPKYNVKTQREAMASRRIACISNSLQKVFLVSFGIPLSTSCERSSPPASLTHRRTASAACLPCKLPPVRSR